MLVKLSWRSLNKTQGEKLLKLDRRTTRLVTMLTSGSFFVYSQSRGPARADAKVKGIKPRSLSLPLGLPETLCEGFGMVWTPLIQPCF